MPTKNSVVLRAILLAVTTCQTAAPQIVQLFDDVPPSAPYFTSANHMYNEHITIGCSAPSPLLFCPDPGISGVNGYLYRYQMAVFVIRAWSIRMWGDAEAFRTTAV